MADDEREKKQLRLNERLFLAIISHLKSRSDLVMQKKKRSRRLLFFYEFAINNWQFQFLHLEERKKIPSISSN